MFYIWLELNSQYIHVSFGQNDKYLQRQWGPSCFFRSFWEHWDHIEIQRRTKKKKEEQERREEKREEVVGEGDEDKTNLCKIVNAQ